MHPFHSHEWQVTISCSWASQSFDHISGSCPGPDNDYYQVCTSLERVSFQWTVSWLNLVAWRLHNARPVLQAVRYEGQSLLASTQRLTCSAESSPSQSLSLVSTVGGWERHEARVALHHHWTISLSLSCSNYHVAVHATTQRQTKSKCWIMQIQCNFARFRCLGAGRDTTCTRACEHSGARWLLGLTMIMLMNSVSFTTVIVRLKWLLNNVTNLPELERSPTSMAIDDCRCCCCWRSIAPIQICHCSSKSGSE